MIYLPNEQEIFQLYFSIGRVEMVIKLNTIKVRINKMLYSSKAGSTVYPEDIQCVWESSQGRGAIYIGNLEASENLKTLKKHSIRAVLTAARDIRLNHPRADIPFHLHVPGLDHERFDLSPYFEEATDFIDQSLRETNILVHCMAGVSRSVTLVLAYLMKHHGLSYQQAYNAVRRKRKIINPNRGFVRQLLNYEKELQREAQAMRRSCEDFRQIRPQSRNSQVNTGFSGSPLYNSTVKNPEGILNYPAKKESSFTDQNSRRSGSAHHINTKYKIDRRQSPANYSSYADVNKQLDSKIASIRQKYMETSGILGNRGGYTGLGRNYATLLDSHSRFKATSNYMNSRVRQGFSYLQNY